MKYVIALAIESLSEVRQSARHAPSLTCPYLNNSVPPLCGEELRALHLLHIHLAADPPQQYRETDPCSTYHPPTGTKRVAGRLSYRRREDMCIDDRGAEGAHTVEIAGRVGVHKQHVVCLQRNAYTKADMDQLANHDRVIGGCCHALRARRGARGRLAWTQRRLNTCGKGCSRACRKMVVH